MRRVVPLSVAFVAALQLFANGFADARVIDEAVGVVKSLEEKLRGSDDRSEKPAGHNHASSDEDDTDNCNAKSLDSKPGREWAAAYGWRFDTSEHPDPELREQENQSNREAAYADLVNGKSPWPDWFEPSVSLLQKETLFQMAMGATQPDNHPGGFGTFDEIDTLTEVRDDLAVIKAWKPDVQRVNTYRVTEILPVYVGPVGPQVDPQACALLPGRFSQFQMLVPRDKRMHHIELVGSHPIEKD